jgi:hypothetical protein
MISFESEHFALTSFVLVTTLSSALLINALDKDKVNTNN